MPKFTILLVPFVLVAVLETHTSGPRVMDEADAGATSQTTADRLAVTSAGRFDITAAASCGR